LKKKKFVIIVAVLTALFLCTETVLVDAASLSSIRKQIQEKKSQLSEQQEEASDLNDQVEALEKDINSKQADIDKLESAITEAEAELDQLEADLEEAEKKVEEQNENLNARLRNMYKNGSVGFIDVLLNSGSFSEFLTNLSLVQKIYSSDKDVLESLQDAYDEIDAKKKEVEAAKEELTTSKSVAEEEKADLESDKSSLEKKKSEIAASTKETQKMLAKLEADAAALSSTIKNQGSSSSTSKYTGGQMAWPAPSYTRISSYFAGRIDPITGKKSTHGGVDLASPYGSAVVAANPGTVIIAGYHSSYGNYIVIDHGGGVATLYGHCSKLLVSKGTKVSRGQRIANVGSTGRSTGNHLHFEVRLNGTRVDPLPYIT
jgi:murein DD-endopeptidase MepM/ murein hydrolase activator NlpD